MIKFDKNLHAYTNAYTDLKYFSVTSLINSYKEPFDVEKFSKIVAKKKGISQDEVKKEWNTVRENACTFGTDSHKKIECYIDSDGEEYKDDPLVIKFLEISDIDIKDVKNEFIVYSNEYRVAGTADFIVDSGAHFNVYDLKTNKNFRVNSKYNKYLYSPLSHLSECEYNIYSLQVSTYAYLYSAMTGKYVRNLRMFWYDKDMNEFKMFETPYLHTDVLNMLNDFKSKGFTVSK